MLGTRMQLTRGLLFGVLLTGLGSSACNKASDEVPTDDSAPYSECTNEELSANYTRYVEPFVSGSTRQSCSECHMTGIDMSIYAQDSACETMACMADSGAVDLDNPAQSAILAQIPAPSGLGVSHGGTSKFNFGYHGEGPEEGVVDCRTDACGDGCGNGLECIEGYCRIEGSYCDTTYVNYAGLAQYFAECASE